MNLQLIITNIKTNEQTRRAIFTKMIECLKKNDKAGFEASVELYSNYSNVMEDYLESIDEEKLPLLEQDIPDGIVDVNSIRELLISEISAYRIAKETGLSNTLIGFLRNGKQELDTLTIKNALKLQGLYKSINKE